jgi:hypothetical protein
MYVCMYVRTYVRTCVCTCVFVFVLFYIYARACAPRVVSVDGIKFCHADPSRLRRVMTQMCDGVRERERERRRRGGTLQRLGNKAGEVGEGERTNCVFRMLAYRA